MKVAFHLFIILATCLLSCQQVADVLPTESESIGESRKATKTATLHFGNQFDYWFFARMHADIWYFPASKPDDEIRRFFQFVDNRNWNIKPSKPADSMDVLERNPDVDYSEEYWHSKTVKAGCKAVFVWNYLDSCNPRYKYRFDIYPPILAGAEREHIIGTDAARACL